jgi:hypothetical protein
VGKDSQSEIFIAAHFPNLAVSLPQYQFASHRLSQSHNWLGDSKPNFPAQNFRISLRTVLRNRL